VTNEGVTRRLQSTNERKLVTKIKAIALAFALALATLVLTSAPASADASALHIRGKGTGTLRIDTETGTFTGVETGVATHLGRYAVDMRGVSTISQDGNVEAHGTATIVAANGDKLMGTFTTSGRQPNLTVTVTITGGTGRFEHAGGTLTVNCVASAPPRQEGRVLVIEHDCTMTGEINVRREHKSLVS
jgi:hypothetical protein